jgi:aminoglycoside 2''-phosphotransferase
MEILQKHLERIQVLYPNLEIKTLERNTDGLVNDIIIVNGDLVCRFVKEDWGRDLLATEAKVLDRVRSFVQIPIPQFEHLEPDFCSYRFIPGQATTRNVLLQVGKKECSRLLHQLGEFVFQMHTLLKETLEGIPNSDAVRGKDDWIHLYEQVKEHLFPHLYRYQRDWVEAHFAPVLSGELNMTYDPVLIHADMAVYHILHDPTSRQLSGILDFGTAGLGDPATDIAVFLVNFGESLTEQMGYPKLEALLPRARFWAGTMELEWALAGVKKNDKGLAVAHIAGARDVGI